MDKPKAVLEIRQKGLIKNEQGIALFLVLWIMALLSVIVAEFCYMTRTEVNITRNFKEETEAYYIARAGMATAINELLRLRSMPKKTAAGNEMDEEKIQWRLDAGMPPLPFEQGAFEVSIFSESGKININRAKSPLLKAMLTRFELTDEEVRTIVDSILDWRDADDLHRLNGAESKYYQDLKPAYKAKNDDFDSVEELKRVRGITGDIYNALKDDLTVYPKSEKKEVRNTAKKKKKSAGDYNRVLLNAASESMLRGLPGMTDEGLEAILEFRSEKAFTSMSELVSLVGQDAYVALSPYVTLTPASVYIIRSVGSVADGQIRRGIRVLLEVDLTSKTKYKIIEWTDDISL